MLQPPPYYGNRHNIVYPSADEPFKSDTDASNPSNTPFSVKDILNLVDQSSEGFSKIPAAFDPEEDLPREPFEPLQDPFYQNCEAFHPQYEHQDLYNHSCNHFYNERSNMYYANSNYLHQYEGYYHPEYSTQNPINDQYAQPFHYNANSSYYQSDFYAQPTEPALPVRDDQPRTSPLVAVVSDRENLETSLPNATVSPGMTSQHVRQLNSLCNPFESRGIDEDDVEIPDTMQSKSFTI